MEISADGDRVKTVLSKLTNYIQVVVVCVYLYSRPPAHGTP